MGLDISPGSSFPKRELPAVPHVESLDVELLVAYHLTMMEPINRQPFARDKMKSSKCLVGLLTIAVMALCAGSALGWDTRWQFKQEAPAYQYGSGPRGIEMREKFDYDAMNRFKGSTDGSNGYTLMRNLNGGTMRGYIDKDGSGLLRDQGGNFYRVNTRW
jgi:hypothetical protein